MGEDDASSDDEIDLPAVTPVEKAGQTIATVAAAESAIDYSKKRPKMMMPATDFAAALDCVAIDPLVVLPDCSTRRALMDSIAAE